MARFYMTTHTTLTIRRAVCVPDGPAGRGSLYESAVAESESRARLRRRSGGISDATLALGRHSTTSPATRLFPLVTAFLPATLPQLGFEPTYSQHARYENPSSNKFAVSVNAHSLRWATRLALATNHPSRITGFLIDSQIHWKVVLTRSKSIECNFAIDRPIGARVPIARPCHGGTNPCLEEENKRKQRRGARLTYGV